MKPGGNSVSFWLVLVVAAGILLSWTTAGRTTPAVTLSPNSISCEEPLILTISVTNLASSGNRVWIELTGNEPIANPHSYVRFSVRDGKASPEINGIINININGDEDGTANSAIITTLKLFDNPFPVGAFRIKVIDADDSTGTASFTITKPVTPYSISGTVSTNDGIPVQNAIIEIVGEDECRRCGVETDSSGKYILYVDMPGSYMLGAFKGGLITKESEEEESSIKGVYVSGNETDIDLTLYKPTRSISGTIRDASTLAGIGGVQIEGECETTDGNYEATVLAGKDGSFTLPALPGKWEIEVSGLHEKGYVAKGEAFSPVEVNGGNIENLDAYFPPYTALIHGTVKGPGGSPVTGDEIVQGQAFINGTFYNTHVSADSNGKYCMGVLAGTWNIGIDGENLKYQCILGLASPEPVNITVQNGDTILHDITLVRSGSIQGRVLDDTLNPIEGVIVSAYLGKCWDSFVTSAETDEEGHYTIGEISAGTYYLWAHIENIDTCPAYRDTWYEHEPPTLCNEASGVNVMPGHTTGNIDFNLEPAGGISGKVTNRSGTPITGIAIQVMSDFNTNTCEGKLLGSANTDGNGNYRICNIPVGDDYIVRTYAENIAPGYIDQVFDGKNISVCDEATTVTVSKGAVTPNINFSLMVRYEGDFDQDGDVDGQDLADEATSNGSEVPIFKFALNFGKSQE